MRLRLHWWKSKENDELDILLDELFDLAKAALFSWRNEEAEEYWEEYDEATGVLTTYNMDDEIVCEVTSGENLKLTKRSE
ncbi:MAG: hypothetical protein AB9Q19_01430 [Candidatus Reddybacter sp.]